MGAGRAHRLAAVLEHLDVGPAAGQLLELVTPQVHLAVPLPLTVSLDAMVPLARLVVAAVGYSLFVGGLTLGYKRIEVLSDGLHMVVFFLGGTMVPLDRLPGWMATTAGWLLLGAYAFHLGDRSARRNGTLNRY